MIKLYVGRGLFGAISMVVRMALLGELGLRKLEERRKEKNMMYGKGFHGWEGPG